VQFQIPICGDFIIIGREQALNAPFALLEDDMLALIARIDKRQRENRNPERAHPALRSTRKPSLL